MLRHYDALGSANPGPRRRVDRPPRLRGVAARATEPARGSQGAGFPLQQVKAILDEVDPVELHGMLRLRRMELEAQIDADVARLAEVEARLRAVDDASGSHELDGRSGRWSRCGSPSVRASRRATTRRASRRSSSRSSTRSSRPWAPPTSVPWVRRWFGTNGVPGTGSASTSASRWMPRPARATGSPSSTCHQDRPRRDRAAPRSTGGCDRDRIQLLASWIDRSPHRSSGGNREVYLDCAGARDSWVLEIQEPPSPGDVPVPGMTDNHQEVPCPRRLLPRRSPLLGRDTATRPPAAMHFLCGVFGWTMVADDPDDGPTYVVARHCAGGRWPAWRVPPPWARTRPSAGTRRSTSATSTKHCRGRSKRGRRTVVGPVDASPAGRLGVLTDPGGARLGLWEAADREEPGRGRGGRLGDERGQTPGPRPLPRVLPGRFRLAVEAMGPYLFGLPGCVGHGTPAVPRDPVSGGLSRRRRSRSGLACRLLERRRRRPGWSGAGSRWQHPLGTGRGQRLLRVVVATRPERRSRSASFCCPDAKAPRRHGCLGSTAAGPPDGQRPTDDRVHRFGPPATIVATARRAIRSIGWLSVVMAGLRTRQPGSVHRDDSEVFGIRSRNRQTERVALLPCAVGGPRRRGVHPSRSPAAPPAWPLTGRDRR